MIWLTAKQHAKIWVAAVALVATCGAAVAGSDAEQFARFKDANQWGAPAGDLNQTRFSTLKDINAGNVQDLQMTWAQSTGALRGHEGQPARACPCRDSGMRRFVELEATEEVDQRGAVDVRGAGTSGGDQRLAAQALELDR